MPFPRTGTQFLFSQSQFSNVIGKLQNIQVSNLIPDRYYQFSIKRVDVVNLVYGRWVDTLTMKILKVSI